MPVPTIILQDFEDYETESKTFVASKFMHILEENFIKYTRAHYLAVNGFESYDWITMNLGFDIWVAWLMNSPVRKTLEFLIPRFCYNSVGVYNSSKKIVDNSEEVFINPVNSSVFWADMFIRFGIISELEKITPGKDKMFKVKKVLYHSYMILFFREYKFLIGKDYVMIYSQLVVDRFDRSPINVVIPSVEKGKPLEAWKIYFPFCMEMLIWIFEFYQDFDQHSWEIPLETIGSGQFSILPGFVEQVIGNKGNIKSISISEEDVNKRLIEGIIEKQRQWFDDQLLVRKQINSFHYVKDVGVFAWIVLTQFRYVNAERFQMKN
jgi:hypothetical protein